ncbi:peptide chain release factor N(5)-glutamine methyltransferase [Peptostreptococcus russellii]|uniref:peptide chain release factor N(5)-glutamine methyltransferase n=1 Tax=Peptostreptococcus russellii TaxID=215200 RepID=UPI003F5872C3
MKKLKNIIAEYTEKLKTSSPTARLDVELLLSNVLGYDDRIQLIMNYEKVLEENQFKKFIDLFEKRMNKMPMAYIFNEKEFMGFNFYVDENVLIPRPDTELIVEELIYHINKLTPKNKDLKVLDMCVGSGAIIISSAKLINDKDNVSLYAVDISKEALSISKKNALNLNADNITFIQSDLFSSKNLDPLKGKLDIIVSNPPYIKEDVIESLESDVKNFEPMIALSGGQSGMDFYNKIIEDSREFLKLDGILIFESGHDQAEDIIFKMKECGFTDIYSKKDIQGFDRMVAGKLTDK